VRSLDHLASLHRRLPRTMRLPRDVRLPHRLRLPRNVRLPRYTVRLRLTLMYGCVFLVCGAGLLAITYVLVRNSKSSDLYFKGLKGGSVGAVTTAGGEGAGPGPQTRGQLPEPLPRLQLPNGAEVVPSPQQIEELRKQGEALRVQARHQHDAELNNLLAESGIALAIMAVVSMGLGWLLAGRALRPLQTIANAARAISASNLHERLALRGPDDELRELGDTIDGLLARLEASFRSQRQFVANASHELRTPLTVERALLEVALADPDASAHSLRHTCERVLACSEEQERLIEALLTLASSERGLERREPLDLGAVVDETLHATDAEAQLRGVRVTSAIVSAPTLGDRRLVARLARNLVDNALRHNVAGGAVEVATGSAAGRATLTVANSGEPIPPEQVQQLFEPFQRLAGRTDHREGHGLGLSIVKAIATAHGATLTSRPRPEGGLWIAVRFPAIPSVDSP
jgi:signal transduction histidine kinase